MKKFLCLFLVFVMTAAFIVMPVSAQLDSQYIDTDFSTAIGGTDFGNIVNGSNGTYYTYNSEGTLLTTKAPNAAADYIRVRRNGDSAATFRTYTNKVAIFGPAPKNQFARVSFKHKMKSDKNLGYVDYKFNWGGKSADWIRVETNGDVKDYKKDKRATVIAKMDTTDYNQFDYVIDMSDGKTYCYLNGVMISDELVASTDSQINADINAWAKGFYHFYLQFGTKGHEFYMRDLSHTLYTEDVTFAMIENDIMSTVIDVTGITVEPTAINNAVVAETYDLTATVAPEDAANKAVTWSTTNESVATVDSNGTVTAIGIGTATITATTDDGGHTATCTINVTTDSGLLPIQATNSGLDGTTTSNATGEFNQDNTSAVIEQKAGASAARMLYLSKTVYDTTDALMHYHFKLDTTDMTGRTQFRVNTTRANGTDTDNTEILNFYGVNASYGEYSGKIAASTGGTHQAIVGNMGGIIDIDAVIDSSTDMIYVFLNGEYAGSAKSIRDLSGNKFNYTSIYAGDTKGNGTNKFTISDFSETLYATTVSYGDVFEAITGEEYTAVTGVTLDKANAALTVGETTQLTATVTPQDADEKRLVWTTSDKDIATVDSSGLVTAVAKGEAIITATSVDSGVYAQCSLTVNPALNVTLNALVEDEDKYVVVGYAEGEADANLIIAVYSADNKLLGIHVDEFNAGLVEVEVKAEGLDKDTAIIKALIINLDDMKPFADAAIYDVDEIWED